jgi:hypothetical protein
MGDRFDRLGVRHRNVEALLRRPGIGHNNGRPSTCRGRPGCGAAPPPRLEDAQPRDRENARPRAERLGITYKELTAALMNTGANLGVAVMPLSLAARVRRGPVAR